MSSLTIWAGTSAASVVSGSERVWLADRAVAGQATDQMDSASEDEGRLGEIVNRSREAGRGGAAGAEKAALLAAVAVCATDRQFDVGDVAEVRGELRDAGREDGAELAVLTT